MAVFFSFPLTILRKSLFLRSSFPLLRTFFSLFFFFLCCLSPFFLILRWLERNSVYCVFKIPFSFFSLEWLTRFSFVFSFLRGMRSIFFSPGFSLELYDLFFSFLCPILQCWRRGEFAYGTISHYLWSTILPTDADAFFFFFFPVQSWVFLFFLRIRIAERKLGTGTPYTHPFFFCFSTWMARMWCWRYSLGRCLFLPFRIAG